MNVLIVGSGGREHALAWKLRQSPLLRQLFCAPGNGGIQKSVQCVDISSSDIPGLLAFAREKAIDLTIVGPEQPLSEGIVDAFRAEGQVIFGPTQAAARLEASKGFAKNLMQRHRIPTADFEIFENYEQARSYVAAQEPPLVLKADGLAAGKGAVVCRDRDGALQTLREMMVDRVFGAAGNRVVVESFLEGEELSVLAICDAHRIMPLIPAQDHKPVADGDRGPNTGGMGAFAPVPMADDAFMSRVRSTILEPAVAGLGEAGIAYTGILYAGLMATPNGPKVVEFNVRFGDPETQAILPLLDFDLLAVLHAAALDRLPDGPLPVKPQAATCVVMASGGYPGAYEKDKEIRGLPEADGPDHVVFHAGTRQRDGRVFTSGGRVLGVTAWDASLAGSIDKAYRTVRDISFEGAFYRRDIGRKGIDGPE